MLSRDGGPGRRGLARHLPGLLEHGFQDSQRMVQDDGYGDQRRGPAPGPGAALPSDAGRRAWHDARRGMSSGPILSGLRPGFASALGAPALAMGATFLAFGAAVREAGLPLPWALGAALLVYGMPGQLVLVQFAAGGGGGAAPAVLGAVAANARFLPMAVV